MQVPVRRAAENIIPRLQERHFIQRVLLLGRNQNHRRCVYASNMDGGKTQGFAVYSVMSVSVWRDGLKPRFYAGFFQNNCNFEMKILKSKSTLFSEYEVHFSLSIPIEFAFATILVKVARVG
jgi:hypothetical protein